MRRVFERLTTTHTRGDLWTRMYRRAPCTMQQCSTLIMIPICVSHDTHVCVCHVQICVCVCASCTDMCVYHVQTCVCIMYRHVCASCTDMCVYHVQTGYTKQQVCIKLGRDCVYHVHTTCMLRQATIAAHVGWIWDWLWTRMITQWTSSLVVVE